jgi:galactokinase
MEQRENLSAALESTYGQDSTSLADQARRYKEDLARFAELYGPGEVLVFRAPGRVNLIGEHTDYNQGYVLPTALDKDVLLLCRPRKDELMRLRNVEDSYSARQFRIDTAIPNSRVGDWSNYVRGPVQLLAQEAGRPLLGMDILVDGQSPYGIPRGSGLSSSSALTVVTAVALAKVNSLNISGPALADACGRAEWYVGTRGGIMDQFIAILARRDHALFLDCQPRCTEPVYGYEHVPLPSNYAVVVVDSGVRHRNTGPHFNRRVAECRVGVRLLQQEYPEIDSLRDAERHPWRELAPLLPETISRRELSERGIDPDELLDRGVATETNEFSIRSRCRHVITENERVLEAVSALQAGDIPTFGDLMNQAHASARDDYEISVPEIEALVAIARQTEGTAGARLTGAGWGGCIVALVANDVASAFCESVPAAYQAETGKHADAFLCRSGPGARIVLRTSVPSEG